MVLDLLSLSIRFVLVFIFKDGQCDLCNAGIIESFIKTLKYEEVLLNDYESFEDAYDFIAYYINEAYNKKRLRSAL